MSILDLSGVVDSFALPGGISVERYEVGGYDSEGFPLPDVINLTPMTAVVHVATSRDLQRLPEGERTLETIIVFTKVPLLTSDTTSKIKADVVRYATKRYRVVLSENWLAQSGHYRCWCQLIEEQ